MRETFLPLGTGLRFSDLARKRTFDKNPIFDPDLFSKLRTETIDKRQLIAHAGAFDGFLKFYLAHARDRHRSDFDMNTRQTINHLHARIENTKDGSPIFVMKLQDTLVGLAFMLQYGGERGPVSWQEMTRSGSFKNDDPKNGSRLACPQMFCALRGETGHIKLMDEVMEFALSKFPSPVEKFKVWAMQTDTIQCQFHAQYAELDRVAFQIGLDARSAGGPLMKVFDYTPFLKNLRSPAGH